MKYIDVKVKKSGKVITIMEAEYDDKLYSKVGETKEEKKPASTKEEKKTPERATKEAKTITSASLKKG